MFSVETITVYVWLSFLWTCYAVRRQLELYGWSWRVPLNALLNFVACPLAIIVATVRGE